MRPPAVAARPKNAGGRPTGTGRKLTVYLYGAEVTALEQFAAEENTPRATLIAELVVESLIAHHRLVRSEDGEVSLPD